VTAGQFGSLSDMMTYSVRNHTAFIAANYQVSERFSLFANLVFNDGRGSLGNLELDPTQAEGAPPGFNYRDISEIGRYSALSIGRTQQMYGFNWEFAPNWVASVVGYYANYVDRHPWLFETDGRTAGVHGGISYIF